MNYNKGDKFIIEIDEIFENSEDDIIHEEKLYRIKGFRSLVFDDNGLDKLEKLDVIKDKMVRKCVADNYRDEAFKVGYNKGLNDAWELARKIDFFDEKERTKIFGYLTSEYIKEHYTVQEALAKLEAYEKEQKIVAGDIVTTINGECEYLVTSVQLPNTLHTVNTRNGYLQTMKISSAKKTGKHIDIQKILDELKEGV